MSLTFRELEKVSEEVYKSMTQQEVRDYNKMEHEQKREFLKTKVKEQGWDVDE